MRGGLGLGPCQSQRLPGQSEHRAPSGRPCQPLFRPSRPPEGHPGGPGPPGCTGALSRYPLWKKQWLARKRNEDPSLGSSPPLPHQQPRPVLLPGDVQRAETVGGPAGGGLVPAAAWPVQEPARRVSAWGLATGVAGLGPGRLSLGSSRRTAVPVGVSDWPQVSCALGPPRPASPPPLLTVLDSALTSELQSCTSLLLSVFWQILEQAFRYFPFKGVSADPRPEF